MAIPVARVHLAMAHAALPGLLPTPPRCMMLLPPLLPAPPCAIILPNNSPPKHSRADAVERWDANKITHGGGGTASPSSSDGQSSLDSESGSPGRASTCESWVSNKIRSAAGAATATSSSSSCSSGSRSSSGGGGGRADSEERWNARKKPASPAASSSASSSKTRTRRISRRPNNNSRAPSASAERWDAHKKQPRAAPPAEELDDGESSTGSNDVELEAPRKQPPPPPPRSFYAGPGFIKSPEPSMLPKPSFMIRAR